MFENLANHLGERLDFTHHPGPSTEHLVVIGHGVTANKDRPFLVALAEGLAAAGVACLRVSFAGNGESEGRFEESTVSKEALELGSVFDAVGEGTRLHYVGHSMGGAVGLLRAATDQRLRSLVSLAGMVRTAKFCERKFGSLTPGRDLMWDKPECPLSQAYVDDLGGLGSLVERAAQVRIPWLLVHGTGDTVVLPEDSRDAATRAPKAELVELSGVDHVFSDAGTPAMVEAVVPWLRARVEESA